MTIPAAIRPGAGERWLAATAPIGRATRTMALVAGASLAVHLAVVGTVAVSGRFAAVAPTEIAVEIVREVPTPTPERPKPAPAKSAPVKPEIAEKEPDKEPTKVAAKPEPVRRQLAKLEPPKQQPPKQEPKREIAKVAKATPQARPAPKAERRTAAAPLASPPARDAAAAERKLAALQQELDSLKAEQARLQAESDEEKASRPTPVALRDLGRQAVALPGITDGAGEAASYEAIVFSALAKAKGIGDRRLGLPGTAGVRFSVDAAGKLIAVELITWSGIPVLDSEALALVRRAVFPPPPAGAQRTFVANVNFELERAH